MESGSLLWTFVIILLFSAMYCAVTETAISSSSRSRLKALADSGNAKAGTVIKILEDFDRAITTILIMTNIVHISIATLVTVAVTRRFGLSAVTVSTIVTTLVVFFAGEMLPKSIAKNYAESAAMLCAPVLRLFMTVLSPLSALLSKIGTGVSDLVKGEPELTVTEDELYDIIEDMTEEGALDDEQGDLISSALQFADITVDSVLTPRVDMVVVDVDDNLEEVLAVVKSCRHSRLPVYEGSVDNIIGILQIRKFIKAWLRDSSSHVDLRALIDPPYFIYRGTKLADALPLMTRNRQTIAIVTDNYGGTAGLVSVEDLVEEIVGEIWDEEDTVEEHIVRTAPNRYSVDADEHAEDVFEEIGFEIPPAAEDEDELADTVIGAWAYENFGRIPKTGDSFLFNGLRVTVESMARNRIRRLTLELPSAPSVSQSEVPQISDSEDLTPGGDAR